MFRPLLLLLLLIPGLGLAQEEPKVEAALVSEHDALAPGETTYVALHLQIEEGWHIYWLNAGEAGMPTKLELTLPKGVSTPGVQWPGPRLVESDGIVGFDYEGEVYVLVPLRVDEALLGKTVTIKAHATWLVCQDQCLPGEASVDLQLPVRSAKERKETGAAKAFAKARTRVPGKLPKGVTASFEGLELRLEAPGAEGLTYFPLDPEDQGPRDLTKLVAKGPKLSVRYPEGVLRAKRVRGLLAIRGEKTTTYHWIELDPPKS